MIRQVLVFFCFALVALNISNAQNGIPTQSLYKKVKPVITIGEKKSLKEITNFSDLVKLKFDTVLALIDSGHYWDAAQKTKALQYNFPESAYPDYLLGICYKQIRKYDSANYHFNRVLRTQDLYLFGDSRLKKGEIALDRKEFDVAEKEFRLAADLMSDNAEPVFMLAINELSQGHFANGRKFIDMSIEVDSTYFPAYLANVSLLMQSSRKRAAIKELDELIQADPDNYNALLMKGRICEQLKRPSRCISPYEIAVNTDPELPAAYWYLAFAQIDDGNYRDGLINLAKFQRIIRDEYRLDQLVAVNDEMLFYEGIRQIGESHDNYSELLIEYVAKAVFKLENRSFLYASKPDKEIDKIIEIAPEDPWVQVIYGALLNQNYGFHKDQAIVYWEKAAQQLEIFS
ncbi:MAG: tetratricopeptide repeat protein, partial [Fulvivirga sp.]|nr:tetratricopeptide repeat protein [Fulvivirga sp.]